MNNTRRTIAAALIGMSALSSAQLAAKDYDTSASDAQAAQSWTEAGPSGHSALRDGAQRGPAVATPATKGSNADLFRELDEIGELLLVGGEDLGQKQQKTANADLFRMVDELGELTLVGGEQSQRKALGDGAQRDSAVAAPAVKGSNADLFRDLDELNELLLVDGKQPQQKQQTMANADLFRTVGELGELTLVDGKQSQQTRHDGMDSGAALGGGAERERAEAMKEARQAQQRLHDALDPNVAMERAREGRVSGGSAALDDKAGAPTRESLGVRIAKGAKNVWQKLRAPTDTRIVGDVSRGKPTETRIIEDVSGGFAKSGNGVVQATQAPRRAHHSIDNRVADQVAQRVPLPSKRASGIEERERRAQLGGDRGR